MKITPEQFDSWRIMPRIMVGLYGTLMYNVSEWFMSLPVPTGAQAAFVSTIVGAAGMIFGFYVNSGRK